MMWIPATVAQSVLGRLVGRYPIPGKIEGTSVNSSKQNCEISGLHSDVAQNIVTRLSLNWTKSEMEEKVVETGTAEGCSRTGKVLPITGHEGPEGE
jgi:hypothetical protein